MLIALFILSQNVFPKKSKNLLHFQLFAEERILFWKTCMSTWRFLEPDGNNVSSIKEPTGTDIRIYPKMEARFGLSMPKTLVMPLEFFSIFKRAQLL